MVNFFQSKCKISEKSSTRIWYKAWNEFTILKNFKPGKIKSQEVINIGILKFSHNTITVLYCENHHTL